MNILPLQGTGPPELTRFALTLHEYHISHTFRAVVIACLGCNLGAGNRNRCSYRFIVKGRLIIPLSLYPAPSTPNH